jgi:soluble lytic murein transglycosylase-like protein
LSCLCFRLGLVLGIVVPAFAASDASSRPARITSVVRADMRTGKLVRSAIVTPRAVTEQRITETVVAPRVITPTTPPPADNGLRADASIDEAVEAIAAQNELPSRLVHSVIKVESNYNPFAISSKGALGLMQLIPATARRFGVSDAFDPVDNIRGGVKYLKYLLTLYDGNYPLALAAYNAGEAAVTRYGGVPPFPETRNYVTLVRRQLEVLKNASPKPAPPKEQQASPAEPTPAGPNHIVEQVQPDGSVRYVWR